MYNIDIICPHCEEANEFEWNDYVVRSDDSEEGTDYFVRCDDFICDNCNTSLNIEGSVWEYPIGAYNSHEFEINEN